MGFIDSIRPQDLQQWKEVWAFLQSKKKKRPIDESESVDAPDSQDDANHENQKCSFTHIKIIMSAL